MKISDWNTNKSLESRYREYLKAVNQAIQSVTFGLVSAEQMIAALSALSTSEAFIALSDAVAQSFVLKANQTEYKSWRAAAKGTNQGKLIYDMLQNSLNSEVKTQMLWTVIRNAELITNMPIDLSRSLTQYIASETMKGRRAQDIADELHGKLKDYTKTKIDLIARTEASKATTALTQARAKDVGVNWYQWRTANDGNRVRESHQHMQGVLVRWDNPPSPEELVGERSYGRYNAGEVFNCRCFANPVVITSQITWPAKVYYGGAIRTMTKAQFESIQ